MKMKFKRIRGMLIASFGIIVIILPFASVISCNQFASPEAEDAEEVEELLEPKIIIKYNILSTYHVTIEGYELQNFPTSNSITNLSLDIPSHIDGYEVRYIADNAFTGLKEINNISFPETIIRIGDYAFKDCVNLSETITLPRALESFGKGVFENCYNVAKFEIGENNKTDHMEIIDDALYAINHAVNPVSMQNSFAGFTLVSYPLGKIRENFKLPDGVTGINDEVFRGNKHLVSINLNDVECIGSDVFSPENNISLITGDKIKLIMDESITHTKWFQNNDNDLITLGNSLIRFTGSNEELNINNYYSVINYAFSDNQNIKNVYIDEEIKFIGKNAFANSALEKIRIFSEVDKVELGINAFGDSNNISIQVIGNNNLHTFINNWSVYSDSISPIGTTFNLIQNNGELPTQMAVYYGSWFFLRPPQSNKRGHTFGGWYIDDVLVNNFDHWYLLDESVDVVAKWVPKEYSLIFHSVDNLVHAARVTFGEALPDLTLKPVRTGYTFEGYFSEKDGNGIRYYDENLQKAQIIYDIDDSILLYAKWRANKYTINYFNGEQTWVSITTFDGPLPDISKNISPNKPGYILEGLYTEPNGKGTKVYDSNEPLYSHYFFDKDINLYAHWIPDHFDVEIDIKG